MVNDKNNFELIVKFLEIFYNKIFSQSNILNFFEILVIEFIIILM